MTNLMTSLSTGGPVFMQGLALSFGLIVAIGAQNAFVLRQGLRREHVGSVVLFCALADAMLIAAGVFGMAQALGERPGVARAMALVGALFLAVYGWRAMGRARQSNQLVPTESGGGLQLSGALAQAAAFTLLNPHVYLDTVLLVGSIGAQQVAPLRKHRQPDLVWPAGLWRALVGAVVCEAPSVANFGKSDRRDDVGVGAAAVAHGLR
jgi:L-lysine exporter family protein LysE/ArgO